MDGAPPLPQGARGQLHSLLTAVMFLTRLPTPRWLQYHPELLARSTTYFPVVGLLVGLSGGTVFAVVSRGWSPAIAAVCATAATVWLTGAFHEDALADSFDGFGGGWDRDQVLAIMKDSRVGSYGVVGLGLVLAGKLGALATLGSTGGASGVACALVAGHTLGRWSSLPLIRRYPYVRETGAKSRPFAASVTTARLAAGTALAGLIAVPALLPFGMRGAAAVAAAVATTALGGRYFRRRVGGITGDCLGAANQLVELAVYLVLAFRWSGA
jgi:adenosylcobinamide-GDP ribazoletransferase